MLVNGQNIISNVNAMLLISVILHVLSIAFERYKKSYRIVDFIKSVFVYNYVIMMVIGYSLQLIILAMTNLTGYGEMGTNGQVFSFLISIVYLIVFLIMLASIARIVNKNYKHSSNDQDIIKNHPQVSTLFENLYLRFKWAQLYYSIFLFRRLIIGVILVFINNAFFQVCSLIFTSLASVSYMITVRPFDDPTINNLEIFNEWVILACSYHLLIFVNTNSYVVLQYQAGWSLDLLIILQLLINVSIYGAASLRNLRQFCKQKLGKKRRSQKYSETEDNLKNDLPTVVKDDPTCELKVQEYEAENEAHILDKSLKEPCFKKQKSDIGFAYHLEEVATLGNTQEAIKHQTLKEQYQGEDEGQLQNCSLLPHQIAQIEMRQHKMRLNNRQQQQFFP